ncbi:MAG: hypothetical protein E7640_05635 [Ruminococcaceae bacterium]|nr:hypothetical protein [Oscillospiraceae bacterium]
MSIIRKFAEPLGFDTRAIKELTDCYEKILAAPGALDIIYEAQELLFLKEGTDFHAALSPIYEKVDASPYEIDMVFLLLSLPSLKYIYRARGYSDELFYRTMRDLLYKLNECRDVYGISGTFVAHWNQKFFTCERFALGRLQFETRAYPIKEPFRDIYKPGDTVIGCHIPSCGPLTEEAVLDSLKQAYEFFSDRLIDGKLYVYCHSWLMYPPYIGTVFSEGSNTYKFAKLFELIKTEEDENYGDYFRVFNRMFKPEELADAPDDTGLRRRLKKFLLDGNKMGEAYGFIEFDGEKVLTVQK